MDRLKDRVALVIGASTGIGYEVCRLFAQEGADLAIGTRTRNDAVDGLVDQARGLGRDAFALEVDVVVEDQVKRAVDETLSRFGRIDILVNNAGIGGGMKPFQEETAEEWERQMAVNLRGFAYPMKHVLPPMIERGYGRIVNTSSQLAHKPSPFNASYCAAKAGVVALTASVSQEVADKGITINVVCPGPTDTPMWRNPKNEDWNRWKVATLPAKRVGTAEESAWAYVFLASDEASYFVGQTLSPNGGDVMW